MSEPPGERVRVTNPLTVAAPHVRRPVREEIDEISGVGDAYVRALVRSQLRLTGVVVLALAVTLGSLPVVLRVADGVVGGEVLGLPLAWLALGVGVYPWLFVLGWLYVRQTDRLERDFAALVEQP
jgi:hypothetical protein